MKWSDALTDYMHYLRIERGLAENSIASYRRDLEKLITFLETKEIHTKPEKISSENLQHFIYDASDHLSANSRARVLSGLRGFFGYLIFEGYREDDPTSLLESPKTGRKLPQVLAEEEIDKMIAAIDLSTPEGERNRAMIETLYSCGLRVSELTGLRFSDLFFEEGFIRVSGKGSKQRFVPITRVAQKYINTYSYEVRVHLNIAKGHEDYVFLNRRGRQLTRAMIFTIVRNLAEKAGVKKKISPHTLRHSFATHLLTGGADLRAIQQMMGHENITTTEVYVHLNRSDLARSIMNFHPRKDG
ncbi:site-specific tyrosine recombinase XerD [Robertkochia aurantiaca]|uniref:site-specific tyrosine recombinase XerD n=1 Tax=Robertkochia aurantiaca TaxID=2873700 RepID=UPI001CC92A19|nr:site-specific tyrosine recombinase XerD [Robertkochia sp. 3YJGBD-33]